MEGRIVVAVVRIGVAVVAGVVLHVVSGLEGDSSFAGSCQAAARNVVALLKSVSIWIDKTNNFLTLCRWWS